MYAQSLQDTPAITKYKIAGDHAWDFWLPDYFRPLITSALVLLLCLGFSFGRSRQAEIIMNFVIFCHLLSQPRVKCEKGEQAGTMCNSNDLRRFFQPFHLSRPGDARGKVEKVRQVEPARMTGDSNLK